MMYAMFWLGEYANILLMCAMGAILFLGGWLPIMDVYPLDKIPAPLWMILKILFFIFLLFALIKAIVPRYRYDQLMRLGWKIFLPFSLDLSCAVNSFYFILTNFLRLIFNGFSRLLKTIFLVEFISGLYMAVKELFRKSKTINYPFEKGN